MLVQSVAAQYPGRVNFVSENFGASKLAEKFGVKGYPAVFVDGVLVAAPREFGYFGEVQGSGRYAPWRDEKSQAKFRADLTRMIDLILAGRGDEVSREHAGDAVSAAQAPPALPRFAISDLAGTPIADGDLNGRVVLVEFWATWCPPCRSTLGWLGELKKRYGDRLAVVALAVESPEAQVRTTAASLSPELRWAIADGATAQAFGDITAVPTMFIFDAARKPARVVYGAPPDLHADVEKTIEGLLAP